MAAERKKSAASHRDASMDICVTSHVIDHQPAGPQQRPGTPPSDSCPPHTRTFPEPLFTFHRTHKLQQEVTMGITVAEGEEYASKFVEAFKGGFPANNHAATMAGLFADTVTIDWSDGFKSDGPSAAIFERFSSTWGAMVSTMCYAPDVLVDTTNSKILITGQAVINVDGGFPEANLVQNKLGHLLTLDESGKVSSWVGLWDNKYPPMLAALAKVMEKMTASK